MVKYLSGVLAYASLNNGHSGFLGPLWRVATNLSPARRLPLPLSGEWRALSLTVIMLMFAPMGYSQGTNEESSPATSDRDRIIALLVEAEMPGQTPDFRGLFAAWFEAGEDLRPLIEETLQAYTLTHPNDIGDLTWFYLLDRNISEEGILFSLRLMEPFELAADNYMLLDTIALAYHDLGDLDRAIELMKRVLELREEGMSGPRELWWEQWNYVKYQTRLALYRAERGQIEEAARHFPKIHAYHQRQGDEGYIFYRLLRRILADNGMVSDDVLEAIKREEGAWKEIRFYVYDAATIQPIEGAKVSASNQQPRQRATLIEELTDEKGEAFISVIGVRPQILTVKIAYDDYADHSMELIGGSRDAEPQESYGIGMYKAMPGGGRVVDGAGEPIMGGKVRITNQVDFAQALGRRAMAAVPTVTDMDGRWRVEALPPGEENVSVVFEHAVYSSKQSPEIYTAEVLRNFEAVHVMQATPLLTGLVTGPNDEPVGGARIVLGKTSNNILMTLTDYLGAYQMKLTDPDYEKFIAVRANGFVPQRRDINLKVAFDGGEDVIEDFQMEKGERLFGNVVNSNGEPIGGASLTVTGWKGMPEYRHVAGTGGEGEFEWRGAQDAPFKISVYARNFKRVEGLELTIEDSPHKIVLLESGRVEGRVWDALTSEPITQFNITHGIESERYKQVSGPGEPLVKADVEKYIQWLYAPQGEFVSHGDGSFFYASSWGEPVQYLKVSAPGYIDVVSPNFSEETGIAQWDVVMRPGKKIEGLLVGPDGSPIKNTPLHVAREGQLISIVNGEVHLINLHSMGRSNRHIIEKDVKTGEKGVFSMVDRERDFLLCAVTDDGYAEISRADMLANSIHELQPYTRLELRLFSNDQPTSGQQVTLYSPRESRPHYDMTPQLTWSWPTKTDENGVLGLPRLRPGLLALMQVFPEDASWSPARYNRQSMLVAAEAQATTPTVEIRAEGLTISGSVSLPATAAESDYNTVLISPQPGSNTADDVALSGPVEIPAEYRNKYPEYNAKLQEDGSFILPQIPPGLWQLKTRIHHQVQRADMSYSTVNTSIHYTFEIPENLDEILEDSPFVLEGETLKFPEIKIEEFKAPG